METSNFILKFGKYKGQNFQSTPQSYQSWLMSQDWFKAPTSQLNAMQQAQKNISTLSNSLKGWDGYSRRGYAIEGRIFEQEMAIENLMYCDCGNRKEPEEKDCGLCGGCWSIS